MNLDAFSGPGLELLRWIEGIRQPGLNAVFMFFHYLGKEPGYLVMAPLLYWVRRDLVGLKIVVGLILTWYLNTLLKHWVDEPRPFTTGAVSALIEVSGTSFPSGHAQLAAFFFLAIALIYRRVAVAVLCAVCVLGIGASRLYLGVHYPHDVLVGYAVGAFVCVPLFFKASSRTASTDRHDLPGRMWWGLGLPALMIAGLATLDTLKMAGLILGLLVFHDAGARGAAKSRRDAWLIAAALAVEIVLFVGLKILEANVQGVALGALLLGGFVGIGAWIARGPGLLGGMWPARDVD